MTKINNSNAYCVSLSRFIVSIALAFCLSGTVEVSASGENFGIALYGGRMTEDKWMDSIRPDTTFVDAYIAVVAGSWTFARFFDGKLSVELEGNVGRHFGDQDHWEFNLPVAARWHRFPWDRYVATSFAWGIGPSYATEVPEVEQELNESTQRWLIFWFAELTMGPPQSRWETLLRLHHRSSGFGSVADDGGANTVCAGLRYRF